MLKRTVLSIVAILFLALLLPKTPCGLGDDLCLGKPTFSPSYTPSEPFNITSDADFALHGFSGNGSLADPYVIVGLNITSDDSTLIWIQNTRSHFRIEDCWFSSAYAGFTPLYSLLPLTIANATNGNITHNEFADSLGGMSLYSCSNMHVNLNRFETRAQTLSVRRANHSTFERNEFGLDYVDFGAWLSLSYNCSVRSNTFFNITNVGVEFSSCTLCYLENNTLSFLEGVPTTNEIMVNLYGGEDCVVHENRIYGPCYRSINAEGIGHSITNNTISGCDYGLRGRLVDSAIKFNTFEDFRWGGIVLIRTNGTLVHHNWLSASTKYLSAGVIVYGGSGSNISSSIISRTSTGIALQGCDGALVERNTVTDSLYGLTLFSETVLPEDPDGLPTRSIVRSNVFSGGGVHFNIGAQWTDPFGNQTMTNNTLNEREIGYFENEEGLNVNGSDYGQVIFANCTGMSLLGGSFEGVKSDLLHLGYIDYGFASPVTLMSCRQCSLSSLTLFNNTMGVKIYSSTEVSLTDVNASRHSWAAVVTSRSDTLTIADSVFYDNYKGIGFSWAWDCLVQQCSFEGNNESLLLVNAPSCNVTGCSFVHNGDCVFLGGSSGGIIHDNSFIVNSRGVLLNSTSDCELTSNVFSGCRFGVVIDTFSNLNRVYDNTFTNNIVDALCVGSGNQWDDGVSIGNYWDTYSGVGPFIVDDDDQDNYPRGPTTGTQSTTTTQGGYNPLAIAGAAGVVGFVALLILVFERRKVTIED